MNYNKRGYAVVFNHTYFHNPKVNLPDRNGTEIDCCSLEHTLKNIGFKVNTYHDLKLQEIENILKKVSKKKFSNYGCLLVAVLSHGNQGIIYAKDTDYSPTSLYSRFTEHSCSKLIGKPKVFIIQACRGHEYDDGVEVEADYGCDRSDSVLITEPDFLIAYSTVPGFYAWRNPRRGSWFIQTLCDELNEYWKEEDLLTILTFVNQRVAYDFESSVVDDPKSNEKKQMPCFTFTLTKLLHFNKVAEVNRFRL